MIPNSSSPSRQTAHSPRCSLLDYKKSQAQGPDRRASSLHSPLSWPLLPPHLHTCRHAAHTRLLEDPDGKSHTLNPTSWLGPLVATYCYNEGMAQASSPTYCWGTHQKWVGTPKIDGETRPYSNLTRQLFYLFQIRHATLGLIVTRKKRTNIIVTCDMTISKIQIRQGTLTFLSGNDRGQIHLLKFDTENQDPKLDSHFGWWQHTAKNPEN